MKLCDIASFFQPKKAKKEEQKEGNLSGFDSGKKQSEELEQHSGQEKRENRDWSERMGGWIVIVLLFCTLHVQYISFFLDYMLDCILNLKLNTNVLTKKMSLESVKEKINVISDGCLHLNSTRLSA